MASRDRLAFSSIQSYPPVSRSAPASLSSPRRTKRKRSSSAESILYKAEEIQPSKKLKISSTPLKLSKENLRRLNAENMDSVSSANASLKRTSSRKTKNTEDTSQKTTVASGSYRYKWLAGAQVYLHADSPDHVEASIKAIVEAEIDEENRVKLKDIAHQMHIKIMNAVRASCGEDRFLNLLSDALDALQKIHLRYIEKSNWREELKPTKPQSDIDVYLLTNSLLKNNDQPSELDEALPSSSKRQQRSADQLFTSPSSAMNTIDSVSIREPQEDEPMPTPIAPTLPVQEMMPPPVAPTLPVQQMMPPPVGPALPVQEGDRSMIKTPRADLTVGILKSSLISRLLVRGFGKRKAEQFLSDLEQQLVSREPGRSPEPVLISVPAVLDSDLAFPFLAIEAKAYATGKQMFEAENQAAVAGACGLKVQLCLDDLAGCRTTSSDHSTAPPLFFSVCTEGPIHALWAHYTVIEEGMRIFQMTLICYCNAVKLKDLEEFLAAFYNVCTWGVEGYFDSVVERLGKVVQSATRLTAS